MEKKVNKTRPRGMSLPAVGELTNMEIKHNAGRVVTLLRKSSNADVYHYAVPEKDGDIFMRRIRVIKTVRDGSEAILNDIPDFIDANHTDLPWAGFSTLSNANKMFNAKFVLTTLVEIIVEFEGVLYNLSVYDEPPVYSFMVIDLTKAGLGTNEHYLEFREDLPAHERDKYYTPAIDTPPPALVEYLGKYGFVKKDNKTFIQQGETTLGNDKIHVIPFGVIRNMEVMTGHAQIRTRA